MKFSQLSLGGIVTCLTLASVACGGGDSDSSSDSLCPSNLVIQTDWWPEIEHGGTYQLIGENGTSNTSLFTYSGPIDPAYAVGGIQTVEIRAGGDAIEFQPVVSVMQTDRDITLGYVNTDDAIQSSATVRVTGVAATLEINPQYLQWDPTQLDIDPSDPTSLKKSGTRILHFPGAAYIDWLIGKGYIDASQSDPNYGGSPSDWIAGGANFIQQGFVTNERYKYQNLIEWKDGAPAPIDYVLIHDLGWQPYPAMYSVLTERVDELSPCLELLVPKLQQAWVDYLANPTPTGDVIIGITEAYNNYWTVTSEVNQAGFELFDEIGIGSNGPDGTYGNFDLDRVQGLYDEVLPLFDQLGVDYDPNITVDGVVTNRFIDLSIGR